MKIRQSNLLFSLIIIAISILFLMPSSKSFYNYSDSDSIEKNVIRVAVYKCSSSYNIRQFELAFNYEWTQNNNTYQFDMTVIDEKDVLGQGPNPLTNDNFDVFLIAASAKSYLFDGVDPKWKTNVQEFVSNGGGYIGICGGANAGSQGFENPTNVFHRQVNKGVLGLANVYINDYLVGEWQYLFKFGFGFFTRDNITNSSYPSYVTVNLNVEKNSENEIFSTYDGDFRDISYAGGPGMYNSNKSNSKLGEIIPLLTYNEELMNTKPLHYWRPTLDGWVIYKNVTTRLLGTYAGIATTYDSNGRVVLYGPHPEHPYVVVNGTIEEYYGRGFLSSFLGSKQYVFNYVGNLLNFSYNVWIVRRSAAWTAKVPEEDLPPISETAIWLYADSDRYLDFIFPIHFGDIFLSTRIANNIKKVDFYIDEKLKFSDDQAPFEWLWNEKNFGKHTIKAVVEDSLGNKAYDYIETWKIW